jgi:ketosteroid isomerase-like protein
MSLSEKAVKANQQEYGDSVTAHDLDRWSLIFAEDAVYHGPDLPALHGRSAIKTWARENFFDLYSDMQNSSEFEVLEVSDTWAAGSGPFRFSGTMTDGTEVPELNGKFMAIYRAQPDGSSRISRLIFNWDAPIGT